MARRQPPLEPPAGLIEPGEELWRSIVAVYELSPAELAILGEACRTADLIWFAEQELYRGPLTVQGSRRQPRAHPLMSKIAEQRRLLDMLIRSLALPMPEEDEGRIRNPRQVAAVQARWRKEKAARGIGG